MKAVNHWDLNKLELRFAVLHALGAAPGTPVVGQMYYDTGLTAPRWWDGAAWTNKATDSALLGGQNLAYTLARANQTGSQTASTISDFDTAVRANRLDQLTAPTAAVALNSQKITGLADPTNPQDAATMGYVQTQVANAAAGIDAKPSVRLKTTGNHALTGLTAIDGVVPSAGDRILAGSQATGSQNGVYVAAAGAWARATDADGNGELTPGAFWYVEEGTANGKTQWRIENAGAIVVGTTAITINQFGGAGTSYTGSTSILLTANAFSVIVKPSGGILAGATGLEIDTAVVARKFSALVGGAGGPSYTVTHNLGTKDVIVSVRDATTDEVVFADVVAATINTVTVTFATSPGANAFRVTVIG